MPSATSGCLAVAAATAVVLLTAACGSDSAGSDSSSGETSSPTSASSSSTSSTSGESGTHQVVVDGTEVTADSWRVKCQKNDAETKGTADLLEDVPVEDMADATFVSVDFEIANGKVSKVSNVSVTGGQSGNLHADTDETTVTLSPSSVRAEGTARGIVDGKQREDIPFTIDISCDSWGGLTDEGDQVPPG